MNKNELKSNQTKKKLCDTFIKLYKEKDIEHITIKNITDEAGFNRGTFYLYYKDIYDILEQIENSLIRKIQPTANNIINLYNKHPFEEIFLIFLNFYKENQEYLDPLLVKNANFINSIKKIIKPLIYKNLINKSKENQTEIDYLIEYHLSAMIGVINSWIIRKKDIPIENLANILLTISTNGILTTMKNKLI